MRKNIESVLLNNLIALAIYICICFVVFPLNFMWHLGIWNELVWKMGLKHVIYNWVTVSIHTLLTLFLYFWAGGKFLKKLHNIFENTLSVIFLFIIIAITTLSLYNNPDPKLFEWLLLTPIFPISETLYFFLIIKEKYAYLIISLLPSITMWIRMTTKRPKIITT